MSASSTTQRILTLVVGGLIGCAGTLIGLSTAEKNARAAGSNAADVARFVDDANGVAPGVLADLETRLAQLELAPPKDRTAVTARTDVAGQSDNLKAELEAITARLDALEARTRVGDQAQLEASMAVGVAEIDRLSVEDAQSMILDATADEAAKLEAWRALRDGGWTDATVQEMIAVARTTNDPSVRADIWRQADAKDKSLALVSPLLDSLAHDPNANVRSEAAETLGNYVSEPGVRPALEFAAARDEDEDVREEARRALGDR